jgi:hypothetical protein
MLSRVWQKFRYQKKCHICEGEEGEILTVRKYGGPHIVVWTFHPGCLKRIICNPEKNPKWMVTYVYEVTKEIESQEAREKKKIEALKRLQPKYECKETR